ncbi:hypothetical protein Y032_0170g245 [Ancylostoma ceylanicum]|uniref:Uncharacterized protein n=1 Tax=Ancylostoma ceylanicum TaxID=53326 RepID=A0A016SVV1_9BILA|nr:hypothetical protein Y032_0170g245 [Ancylostoma ceylanicum]
MLRRALISIFPDAAFAPSQSLLATVHILRTGKKAGFCDGGHGFETSEWCDYVFKELPNRQTKSKKSLSASTTGQRQSKAAQRDQHLSNDENRITNDDFNNELEN